MHATVMWRNNNIQTIVKFYERKYHLLKYYYFKYTSEVVVTSNDKNASFISKYKKNYFHIKRTLYLMHCRWLVIINKVVFV